MTRYRAGAQESIGREGVEIVFKRQRQMGAKTVQLSIEEVSEALGAGVRGEKERG